MALVDANVISAKLRELASRKAKVSHHAPATAEELKNDGDAMAHGYGDVKPILIHDAATTGLADLDAFAREVAEWAGRRP